MPSKILRTIRFVFAVTLATRMMSFPASADEPGPVWGVSAGDRFQVSVVIVKQTEVTIDDQPPTLSETKDRFLIEYRVAQISATGDAVIVASLRRPVRETGTASPASLKSAAEAAGTLEDLLVVLHVDSEGVVQKISPTDREALIAQVSSLDPSVTRLLQNACSDDVIAGWFGRPFWLTTDPATAAQGQTWSRSDEMTVGVFGTLRSEVELKAGATVDQRMGLEMSGTGRFVPLVVPETDSPGHSFQLKNVDATLDQFTGRARMFLSPAEANPDGTNPKRPQFESMEVTVRLHGSGTHQQNPSDKVQQVSFRQTQIQSWTLVDFQSGRPEFRFSVPVPIPARVR